MKSPTVFEGGQWPREGLEAVPACPICGSASRHELHAGLVDDTFFTAPGTWNLQQCADCRSAYLDPRPTAESIVDAYAAYYTHASPANARGRGLKALAKAMLRRLSDAYAESLCERGHRGRSWKSRVGSALVKSLPPCREMIDARYRHLRRPSPGSDRLLDVGCGSGDFLQRAEALGWKVEGVDFDPKAVAAARAHGLNVSVGSIDAYADARDRFDVVTCNHVIEHVYDPVHLVRQIHRILKPGGKLWIETPNLSSVGHASYGKAWRGLEPPRHLAIFSHRALVKLLEGSGFSISHTTPWNLQHIRMMFAASEAITRGGDPHDTRTPLLPNWQLLKALLLEALFVDRREFVSLRASKAPRSA